MNRAPQLAERVSARFGTPPQLYRAPGRVNLIGEHTDYNDGLVLPAAIDFYCWVAVAPRRDEKLVMFSEELSEQFECNLGSAPQPQHAWSDYPVGVAVQLQIAGFTVPPADLLIHSTVPIGAGLSSSAAIEVATAMALTGISQSSADRLQLARLCQAAENDFVGMKCGIMDQFISLHGRAHHAVMLDCRSLAYDFVPIPKFIRLVVCDTGVKHQLAGSEYNRRRAECEQAVAALRQVLPDIRALRDVNSEQLERHRHLLSHTAYKRALHVVTENDRVLQSVKALRDGDLPRLAKCMAESHASLRDLYEVSCRELDLMVEIANRQQGVYGARMTGGGFGGSTINLVHATHAEEFAARVAAAYQQETGISPHIYQCAAANGAERVATESPG